ncbi:small-conductance mechanosensitive channel, partial [Bradyrhizobium sp. SHOUNA76]|nr:small-conductance mechanosensitive channel [Bradyrhizobium sp. SHOUNA76]
MSHKLAPALLAALFLAISSLSGARAETPAANSAAALSPEEAKRALVTLQDDKKRAQMIDTLRAIANASGPQAPAPEQKSPIPLAADGLGAQLLLTVSEEIGAISSEIASVARTLTHFPAFYYWIVRTANDPAAYNLLIEIAWKLALVLGCALAAEWVLFRLIRRPVAFLEGRVPHAARLPAQALPIAD